jgi:indole-3-glycerol phosphate synthase
MADVLARILATKREEVSAARAAIPLERLEEQARAASPPRGFARALQQRVAAGRAGVIAEIKRASPSRGAMRLDLDPARIARSYEAHGAACLSVLTDREYFKGSPEDLRAARAACALPVIRKDFIIDPYQVVEARAWGADCVLLIMDAAPDDELLALEQQAHALGMDVLVESHDAAQFDRAVRFKTPLLGINNRNLRNFETRIETTLDLLSHAPLGKVIVTESGIEQPTDVTRLFDSGVCAYLVGGALMAAPEPGAELARIFNGRF